MRRYSVEPQLLGARKMQGCFAPCPPGSVSEADWPLVSFSARKIANMAKKHYTSFLPGGTKCIFCENGKMKSDKGLVDCRVCRGAGGLSTNLESTTSLRNPELLLRIVFLHDE
jgi:hypothetical protein